MDREIDAEVTQQAFAQCERIRHVVHLASRAAQGYAVRTAIVERSTPVEHKPAWLVVVLAAILVAACGARESPEEQVRAVIASGEAAAEARDLSGLMDLVSGRYGDEDGRGRAELQRYVHGYLIAHQSIHLLTRVDSIEFPYRDMARVRLTLGSVGREATAETSFELAADVERLTLELQLEDGEWKLTRAHRNDAA